MNKINGRSFTGSEILPTNQEAMNRYFENLSGLTKILQKIYNEEINIYIKTLWGGGWDLGFGGCDCSGFLKETTVKKVEEIEPFFKKCLSNYYKNKINS